MKKRKKTTMAPLLEGMPYTPSVRTNILLTFKRFGFVPPSEYRFDSYANQSTTK